MTPGDFGFQIIGPLFFLIVLLLPILLTGLLFYLLLWLMDTTHTVVLGLMEGTLAELCRRRKKRLCIGGIVLAAADLTMDAARAGLKGSPTKVKKTFTPDQSKAGVIIREPTAIQATGKLLELLGAARIL